MSITLPVGDIDELNGGIHPVKLRQKITEAQHAAGYSNDTVGKVANLFYGSRIIDRLTENEVTDLASTLTTMRDLGWTDETLSDHMDAGLKDRIYEPPPAGTKQTEFTVPEDLTPQPNLTVPKQLPVRSLSPSSIETWIACRAQWKHKYIDKQYDPKSLPMVAGTAVGNTLAQLFVAIRDSKLPGRGEADDILLAEWALALNDDVDFGDNTETDITEKLENARSGIESFYTQILPGLNDQQLEVVEVEKEIRFSFPDTDWHVKGFLDVLTKSSETTPIFDVKWGARHKKTALALRGIQPRIYMAGMFLETGTENQQFQYISGKDKLPKSGGDHWAFVPDIDSPARQNLAGHVRILERVALVAREIARCYETGDWDYSDPDNWRCSPKFCSAYKSCPGGGLDISK